MPTVTDPPLEEPGARACADPRRGGASSRALARVARTMRRHRITWWAYRMAVGICLDQSHYRTSLAAAGVAFWLLIAIFPAAMAVVSVFGLVLDPQEIARNMGGHGSSDRGPLASALQAQVVLFAEADTGTLSLSLVISAVVLMWSASVLVYGASRAIRMTYGLLPLGYVRLRLQCLAAAGAMVLIMGVAVWLFDALDRVEADLGDWWAGVFAVAVQIPLRVAALAAVLIALVRFSVGRAAPIRRTWPGMVVTAAVVLIVLAGFGPYVALFGQQYEAYGAAAGVVIGMLLAWITSYLVLLGVVANTVGESLALDLPDKGDLADRGRRRDAQRSKYRAELERRSRGAVPGAS